MEEPPDLRLKARDSILRLLAAHRGEMAFGEIIAVLAHGGHPFQAIHGALEDLLEDQAIEFEGGAGTAPGRQLTMGSRLGSM